MKKKKEELKYSENYKRKNKSNKRLSTKKNKHNNNIKKY